MRAYKAPIVAFVGLLPLGTFCTTVSKATPSVAVKPGRRRILWAPLAVGQVTGPATAAPFLHRGGWPMLHDVGHFRVIPRKPVDDVVAITDLHTRIRSAAVLDVVRCLNLGDIVPREQPAGRIGLKLIGVTGLWRLAKAVSPAGPRRILSDCLTHRHGQNDKGAR